MGVPPAGAWASRPLGHGRPARWGMGILPARLWRERDAPAPAGETPALRQHVRAEARRYIRTCRPKDRCPTLKLDQPSPRLF